MCKTFTGVLTRDTRLQTLLEICSLLFVTFNFSLTLYFYRVKYYVKCEKIMKNDIYILYHSVDTSIYKIEVTNNEILNQFYLNIE